MYIVVTFEFIPFRVEKIHVDACGSNAGTLLSCSRDGTIKYWNICRYVKLISFSSVLHVYLNMQYLP